MRRPLQTPNRRAGFTLVELLVVILIIAILVALLVPAIAAAVRAANTARVAAEITNLQTALADFKSKYGEYPPSRILLLSNAPGGQVYYNTGDPTALNGTNDITLGALNSRTVRAMRKFFPRAGGYFNTSGPITPIDWDGPNFNSIGVLLQGHECLAFFLGGMPEQTLDSSSGLVTGYFMSGFSRDPQNPFGRTIVAPNRSAPLFEFSPGRLQDAYSLTLSNTGGGPNGFPSYIDPLSNPTEPRPYAYFSSYGNNAYDPNDDNSASTGNNGGSIEIDDSGNPIGRSFLVSNTVILSGSPNPYTNGNPISPIINGAHAPVSWVNPQTFQIISAGSDGQWGYGGGYEANASEKLPAYANDSIETALRSRERDNVTNFTGGKIE